MLVLKTFKNLGSGRSQAFCGMAALSLAFAGCDSGGTASASGGAVPRLNADYGMRRDLRLASDVPSDVRVADLNDDGVADLVQANSVSRELLVTLGMPDGTFTAPTALATAGVPWRTATADFDADGLLDIAAVSLAGTGGAASAAEIFLQGPMLGEFQAPIVAILSDDPDDLAVAPRSGLIGDPVPADLFVTINSERRVLRMRLNGGALDLVEELTSANLGRPGSAFTVASFDMFGDGTLDLAVAESQVAGSELGRVVVYERVGEGFAEPVLVYEPVYWPTVDNVGAVTKNGLDSLAVSQVDNGDVVLLVGDSGGLRSPTIVSFGPGTTSVEFEDLNGDGLADAAATIFSQAALYVRLANGPLSWDEPVRYDVGFLPRSLGVIELPGDSLPDLVVANILDTSLLVNAGGGQFRGARGYPLSALGPEVVRSADLDVDGDLDAVVLTVSEPALLWLENDGQGNFQEVYRNDLEEGEEPFDFVLVEGDAEAGLDALVTIPGSDEVRLFSNPMVGFLIPPVSIPVGMEPLGIDAGDLDLDGDQDLVVALGGEGALEVLLGDPSSGFASAGKIVVTGVPLVPHLGDLDRDGDLDLAVSTGRVDPAPAPDPEAALLVIENEALAFIQRRSFPLDTSSLCVTSGRVDRDATIDLVVGQRGPGQTELFLLRGLGGFDYQVLRIETGTLPNLVRLADLNGDLRSDLLLPSAQGELVLALGNGLGAFPTMQPQTPGELSLLFGVRSVAYVDVDQDPQLFADLLYVSTNAPMLWVAPNQSQEL